MEINLISDTVTKPSPEMLRYMFDAQVGDDVYKQDPTVINLEARLAAMFGMEAGLFFPSGTMANQTAIKLNTNPGDQIIADKYAHIYNYEGGGASFNSGVSFCLLNGTQGKINASQVAAAINDPEFYHSPLTSMVGVENTTNKGGGACYEIDDLIAIKKVCIENNLKFHLDGARIWNALIAKNQKPSDFGPIFDTISVCLSKGLGAPVGSVLLASEKTIHKALRIRKILGGGMRQVGYLAAAGIYALDNNFERLAIDHKNAKEIGTLLATLSWVKKVEPIETNILIFEIQPTISEALLLEKLKQKNIFISNMGHGKLRIVTHLDYNSEMHEYFLEVLKGLEF